MQQPFLKGWLEIGMSNPNIFLNQSNSDIILRTYDDNTNNKIIIGNTSSNNTPNCVGALYIFGNNVGLRTNPRSNITLDVDGTVAISSNVFIGTTSKLSTTTLTGDFVIANSNTSNMTITNTSNTFKLMYGNVERLKITNGIGLYLNDNVYITNDVYASSFHMTSDSNLKDNIQQSSTKKDLQTLLKININDYSYIADTQHTQRKGFIAQNVERVFPQAIKEYEGVIPFYQNQVYVWSIGNGVFYMNISKEHSCTKLQPILAGDNLVLGRDNSCKDCIVSVSKVVEEHFDYLKLLIHSHLSISDGYMFLHGRIGIVKTIDPNQILALCVSSIQELHNIYSGKI